MVHWEKPTGALGVDRGVRPTAVAAAAAAAAAMHHRVSCTRTAYAYIALNSLKANNRRSPQCASYDA